MKTLMWMVFASVLFLMIGGLLPGNVDSGDKCDDPMNARPIPINYSECMAVCAECNRMEVAECNRNYKEDTQIKSLNDLLLDLSKERPKNKLHLDLSTPLTLSYIIQYKQFHSKQPRLISGFRPEEDKPKKASSIIGQKQTDRDWVLEEGLTAIWVTGISGPAHHDRMILRARLEEKGDSLILQGYQVMKIGKDQEKKTSLRPGEYIFYSLPGSKSNTCPVELAGNSVEIAFYDEFNSIILQAIKPGVTKLKIFTLWWRDIQPKFLGEYEIVVE